MTIEQMLQAAEIMKSSRCSDQRIASIELERMARIFTLAERALKDINFLPIPLAKQSLPPRTIKIHYLPNYSWPSIVHKEGDSCFDLRACDNVIIEPGRGYLMPLGVIFDLPEDYGMVIRPRSSLSKYHVLLEGGEIDPGYRGEIGAPLFNAGQHSFLISAGDRIVQGRLIKIHRFEFESAKLHELTKTNRGANGFGSTGTE